MNNTGLLADKTPSLKVLTEAAKGEFVAYVKYKLFAKVAEKDGLFVIAQVFSDISSQEFEHFERFIKLIKEIKSDFTKEFLISDVGEEIKNIPSPEDTLSALKYSMDGEYSEFSDKYLKYAEICKDNQFLEAAEVFVRTAKVENIHFERFKRLATLLEEKRLFVRDDKVAWVCTNCGNIEIVSSIDFDVCPLCEYPYGYYKPYNEIY